MRKTNKQDIKTIIALILFGILAFTISNILFELKFPFVWLVK